MAVASNLLAPHDMPISRKYIYCCRFKGIMDKTPLYSFRLPLSSHSVRQDALSFYVLNNFYGPLSPRCGKLNGLLCQSLLKPGGGNEVPILKVAATILSRSFSNLQVSPVVLQLVPAVGLLAFAACGLVPLMCFGRSIFLNKPDNNWKKSGTYYITTSYLQPMLLWTGGMLLCRALDPLVLPSIASQGVKQRLLNFVRSLSTVLAFAYCLSSLIQQARIFFMETKDSADTRNMGFDFAGKAVYTAVWVAAASLFMELLGFSTQKWLTAGGLGTVLLTLAGREILTNFLSSVMIHATQPFAVNDWIQTKIEGYEVSGTVEHVGWWSPTVIRGDDREANHIPSHKFTVNVVRNLSQKTHWRIKTHLAISHLDVNKINTIVADMRKVLAKNPQIEQQKLHRRVFLDNVDSETQALLIMVSCFVKTSRFEEYLCVKESILLDLLRVISHHRARLATPIRTVQKVYGEPDVDTVSFADSIFAGTRAASNSQMLLLGPSFKVNDDKTRAPDHSVQADEGDDEKAEAKAGPPSNDKLQDMDFNETGQSNSELSEGKEFTGIQRPSIPELRSSEAAVAAASSMPDVERQVPSPPKTSLEDNIVLGVALEGSKMTLPIEEDLMPPPPTRSEVELAAHRNGNGPSSTGSDKQDETGESPAAGGLDQRVKEK